MTDREETQTHTQQRDLHAGDRSPTPVDSPIDPPLSQVAVCLFLLSVQGTGRQKAAGWSFTC